MKNLIFKLLLLAFLIIPVQNILSQTVILDDTNNELFNPSEFIEFDNKLFFTASTTSFGQNRSIYFYEGNFARRVTNSIDGQNPIRIKIIGGKLLYQITINGENKLASISSSSLPTQTTHDFSGGDYKPAGWMEHNGRIYFVATFQNDIPATQTIWSTDLDLSDLTSTSGPILSSIGREDEILVGNGDRVYFVANEELFFIETSINTYSEISLPSPPGSFRGAPLHKLQDYVILPLREIGSPSTSDGKYLAYINTNDNSVNTIDYFDIQSPTVFNGNYFYIDREDINNNSFFRVWYIDIGNDGLITESEFKLVENGNPELLGPNNNTLIKINNELQINQFQLSGVPGNFSFEEIICPGILFEGSYYSGFGNNINNLHRCENGVNETATCLDFSDWFISEIIEFDNSLFFSAVAPNGITLLKYPEEIGNGFCQESPNCTEDDTPPICIVTDITITGDSSTGVGTFTFTDYATDDCGNVNYSDGNDLTNDVGVFNTESYACGSVTNFQVGFFDDNNNVVVCNYTVTVVCESQENPCFDFEDNSIGNWTDNGLIDQLEVISENPLGNPSQVLFFEDGQGASIVYNDIDFRGNWIEQYQNQCASFDYKIDYDTNIQPERNYAPKITIYASSAPLQNGSNWPVGTTRASFISHNDINVDNVWFHYELPIELSNNGQLPQNTFGQWVIDTEIPPGETEVSIWNNLITDVRGIILPADYNSSPTERIYLDNLCFEDCEFSLDGCFSIQAESPICNIELDTESQNTFTYDFTFTNTSEQVYENLLIFDNDENFKLDLDNTLWPLPTSLNPGESVDLSWGIDALQFSGETMTYCFDIAPYNSGGPCCKEQHCIELVSCCDPEEVPTCTITPVNIEEESEACCYEIGYYTCRSETFDRLIVQMQTEDLSFSAFPGPGFRLNSLSDGRRIEIRPQNQIFLPADSIENIITICVENLISSSPEIQDFELIWSDSRIGDGIEIYTTKEEELNCPPPEDPCTAVTDGRVYCGDDGLYHYEFRVTNLSDQENDASIIVLDNGNNAGDFVPQTFPRFPDHRPNGVAYLPYGETSELLDIALPNATFGTSYEFFVSLHDYRNVDPEVGDYWCCYTLETITIEVNIDCGDASLTEGPLGHITYPNPVLNELKIEFHESLESDTKLLIQGIGGATINQEQLRAGATNHKLNTSDLTPGLYFLKFVNQEGKVKHSMFVKE